MTDAQRRTRSESSPSSAATSAQRSSRRPLGGALAAQYAASWAGLPTQASGSIAASPRALRTKTALTLACAAERGLSRRRAKTAFDMRCKTATRRRGPAVRASAPTSTATGEVHHVLVEVERVRRRPRPGRLVAAQRLVTGEAGLEHALAARQRRQLSLEVIRPRRGQDRLYRRQLPLQRRRLDGPHRAAPMRA